MKVTIARHNEDRYIIVETEGMTVTFKAEMLMKTSEIIRTKTENTEYESEVFEITFLREERNKMTNYKDNNGKERT